MTTSVFARAYSKINWGLELIGRRDDGYHEIVTLTHTVSLADGVPAPSFWTRALAWRPGGGGKFPRELRPVLAAAMATPTRGVAPVFHTPPGHQATTTGTP